MFNFKRVTALAVAFLLTLCLCVWVLLVALLTTAYTPTFVTDYIDDEFCSAAYGAMMEIWTGYGEPAHIPQKVFEEALPEDQFQADFLEYAHTVWNGDYTYHADTERVSVALMTAFTDYATKLDVTITDELNAALQTLRDSCVEAYSYHVHISLLDDIRLLLHRIYKPALIVLFGVSLLLVGLGVVAVRIHRYWFHGLRNLVYTLYATFLVLAPPAILMLCANPLSRLNLQPTYLRLLFVDLTNRYMWQLLIVAAIALVAGIVLMIVSERRHNQEFHPTARVPGRIVLPATDADTPL